MPTAAELRAQAAANLAQAEELEKAEKLAKIDSIKQAIADAGLTMADFGLPEPVAKKTRKARAPSVTVAPTTVTGPDGQVWGGRGRKPAWLLAMTTVTKPDMLAATGEHTAV